MPLKSVMSVILVSLASHFGCYSSIEISKEELIAQTEPSTIHIYTRDLTEYDFPKGRYIVAGDSLSGVGLLTSSSLPRPGGFRGSIALADITRIEEQRFSTLKTLLLVGGSAFVLAGAIGGSQLGVSGNFFGK